MVSNVESRQFFWTEAHFFSLVNSDTFYCYEYLILIITNYSLDISSFDTIIIYCNSENIKYKNCEIHKINYKHINYLLIFLNVDDL